MDGFTLSTALKACFDEGSSDIIAVQVQPPIAGAGGVVPCQQVIRDALGQRGVGLRTGGGQGSPQSTGWRCTASLHLLEDPWSTADGKAGEEQHNLHKVTWCFWREAGISFVGG